MLPGRYGSMMFRDEVARLDAVARTQLAAQTAAPIALVPETEIAALRKLVAAGRVRDNGPRCGKTPTLERAIRLHYPDAWAVQADAACMGSDCTLWLYVREPTELRDWDRSLDWPVRAEGSENVTAVTDVAAFETALHAIKLAVPAPADGVEGGVIGGMGTGRGFGFGSGGAAHRHAVIDVEAAGSWAAPPAIKDLDGEQRRFDACPATKAFDDEALLDIDAHGKVDRCETEAPKCLCDVLRAHTFPAGPALRRAIVRFAQTGAGGGGLGIGKLGKSKHDLFVMIRGYGSEFGDDSETMHAQEKALRTCFAPSASTGRYDADVVMTVDESGAVKDARVTKGHDKMSDPEQACVTKWAKSLKFSCETLGGDPAKVTTLMTVMR